MKKRSCDVLIVGGGLSGLYTALLIDGGLKVVAVVKNTVSQTNSHLAQGGIASEMSTDAELLSSHFEDTMIAGSRLNDERAVRVLIAEAKENIEQLMRFGVRFDLDKAGLMHTTKEGGHSHSRVLHSGGDATGKEMMGRLWNEVKKRKNIEIVEDMMVYDIAVQKGETVGAKTLRKDGETLHFQAGHVVLATGGIGALYKRTTNASVATGCGIALAQKAGARIRDMAFVQFHPSAFYSGENDSRFFLLSEALRGEGAVLRNIEGALFAKRYHKDGELAPRDVVAQAIDREMYDTWADYVYLDTSPLGETYAKKRFPTIAAYLEKYGYALGKDWIPITPVEHFLIGGVETNLHGESTLPYLYAVGECASTGVHGGNRLASNSLLECVVFARRIAHTINRKPKRAIIAQKPGRLLQTARFDYAPARRKIRQLMEEHAGIVRQKSGLLEAKKGLQDILNNLRKHENHHRNYYETLHMTLAAIAVVEDALEKETSAGCHFRLD